jgi:hypothetical protein
MGVAVGLAAALGEPIKIAQPIGFANKRRDTGAAEPADGMALPGRIEPRLVVCGVCAHLDYARSFF